MLYCHLIPRSDFYPRSPCGERLAGPSGPAFLYNFYPRSPCGERQRLGLLGWLRTLISIHALLAESDQQNPSKLAKTSYFYPRSPCGERLLHCTTYLNCSLFLSTLSLRRATRPREIVIIIIDNFYPRSPCGERLRQIDRVSITRRISIHALLAESDP